MTFVHLGPTEPRDLEPLIASSRALLERGEDLEAVWSFLRTEGGHMGDCLDVTMALTGMGLPRVLTEGGPSLLGGWLGAGVVDELCLTTSPVVVAGRVGRIVSGPALPDPGAWRLGHLIEDDGTLLARWVRA